ncbi:dihydrofolate reductase [Anaerotignum sp.]|uniref:dihydrofolate reductase n=1 Tax=Anaerotignum sp. TaxID=2039241 RepID=UPI0028B22774|nr:dihydrofolate reductase [Anaerotignum sp.]
MNLMVAVDERWGIGKDGDLLRRISTDMKRFRAMTTGNVLILGRKTLESFPNKKPLPNREHIVLTQNLGYQAEGVTLCHSIEELPQLLKGFGDKEVFVAGGGSVYEQLLPLCEKAYVTKIHDTYPADTFFPNLDELPEWEIVDEGEALEDEGIKFSFVLYQKKR